MLSCYLNLSSFLGIHILIIQIKKTHYCLPCSIFRWQFNPFNSTSGRPSLSFSQPISPVYFNPPMFGCQDSPFLHILPINTLFAYHLEDNSKEANFASSSTHTSSKDPATLNTQRVIEHPLTPMNTLTELKRKTGTSEM